MPSGARQSMTQVQIAGIASNGNATVCGMPDYGTLGAATAINVTGQAVGYVNPTIDFG